MKVEGINGQPQLRSTDRGPDTSSRQALWPRINGTFLIISVYCRNDAGRQFPYLGSIVVLVAVLTYTATPIYEARAQLLIEAETQNIVTFKEVVEQEMSTVEYYTTQYKILQSRALARVTLEKLGLWDHPEFIGTLAKESSDGQSVRSRDILTNSLAAIEGAVIKVLGSSRIDNLGAIVDAPKFPEGPSPEEDARQSLAIQVFLSRLTITPIRNSRLIDVKFRSTDPKLAASVVNALAQSYIDRMLQFKLSASKEAADWLANQLDEQKEKVLQSERSVQQFREQHSGANEDAQVTQKLNDLNAMITRARTDRLQRELMFKQVLAAHGDRAGLLSFPAIDANPSVQRARADLTDLRRKEEQLLREFGHKWPAVAETRTLVAAAEEKLDAEAANAVKLLSNEVLAAQAHEDSIVSTLNAQKAEALARNRTAIGVQSLEREAASNRQIFDTLMQRAKETNISSQLRTNNIRIADEADAPVEPVWPNKQQNLLFALLAGTGLAVGLAFAAEYMDNKFKTPEEIRDDLGLRCLGLVPKLSTPGSRLLTEGVEAIFAEAFRAVRTNVQFSFDDGGVAEHIGRSLVVTSTAPSEGKTLVASNLAVGLAMAGQRVVLIDADMRRPTVHEIFQQPQEPGLSNLIAGTISASQAFCESGVRGLWLVLVGYHASQSGRALSSPRFKDILKTLCAQCDWVIIDSPPAMAVIDASVIAHIAGGVLFVVSSEKTSRPAAIKALEQLDAANANFVGAVLNRVDMKRNAFFYSPYYRREYSAYYSRTA